MGKRNRTSRWYFAGEKYLKIKQFLSDDSCFLKMLSVINKF